MQKTLLILLVACSLMVSCTKNKIKRDDFFTCTKLQNLDSSTVGNKIIGAWLLTKQKCYWANETNLLIYNTKVTFNTDRTYFIKTNNIITVHGNWNLVPINVNNWSLNLTTQNEYLYGCILFCNNQLMFYNSYIDGCDNLFYKSN